MRSHEAIDANQLQLTPRGEAWLRQFDIADLEDAKKLLSALTLVSHSEFERSLTALIMQVADSAGGPIALFATREIDATTPLFENDASCPDAVSGGSDLGSEARVAAIIRNLSRAEPEKYLNHPSVQEMRLAKCRALVCVDDFIGSGERTREFLQAIWKNRSIRSWKSMGIVALHAVAYSATEAGKLLVESMKGKIQVTIERDCPTLGALPWKNVMRKRIDRLLKIYATRTAYPHDPLGYNNTGAALVFEHGCPDNCPVVFWAPAAPNAAWTSLFPNRSVVHSEKSAFPPEIARRDPVVTMIDVGQKRLAASGALSRRGPIGNVILTVLALAAKGIRTRSALSHATGVSALNCGRILDLCVGWKFLNPRLRLTKAGLAELNYAKSFVPGQGEVPMIGENEYYPKQLRGSVDG
jgi:hypothetical protein